MTKTADGWLLSAKTIMAILASLAVVLGGVGGVIGWGFGLYNSVDKRMNGMERRIAIAESSSNRMGDDIKEIKAMMNQMMMNRVDNRPDVGRWAK